MMVGPRRNTRTVQEQPWMEYAACRGMDPDLWFPPRGMNGYNNAAKRVCAACTVRESCLDFAVDQKIREGIWGGLTDKERRPYARRATG